MIIAEDHESAASRIKTELQKSSPLWDKWVKDGMLIKKSY
jgi:hypothetical protein